MTLFQNFLMALGSISLVGILSLITAIVMAQIITGDIEAMDEQTYIITKDGEKILYNEEDQE